MSSCSFDNQNICTDKDFFSKREQISSIYKEKFYFLCNESHLMHIDFSHKNNWCQLLVRYKTQLSFPTGIELFLVNKGEHKQLFHLVDTNIVLHSPLQILD